MPLFFASNLTCTGLGSKPSIRGGGLWLAVWAMAQPTFQLGTRDCVYSWATDPAYEGVPEALFSGRKRPALNFTVHIHLVPRLRMTGAVPPFPLYVFMACRGTEPPWTLRRTTITKFVARILQGWSFCEDEVRLKRSGEESLMSASFGQINVYVI